MYCTHSHGGQQPLWHVCHHDSHEEDHGLQKLVADEHGHHEEGEAEGDGQAGDDVHEMFDLDGDGGLLVAHPAGQAGDAPDDGAVPCVDDDAGGHAWREEQREMKSQNTERCRARVSVSLLLWRA